MPKSQNIGLRASIGHVSSQVAQHVFYIGSLDYLRGFGDGQLQGNTFWQSNLEYRIASLKHRWIVLQHAAFVDAAATSYGFDDLFDKKNRPRFSSGGGIRLISPKIYRLVLRLDYVFAYDQHKPHGLSFGVQQFF